MSTPDRCEARGRASGGSERRRRTRRRKATWAAEARRHSAANAARRMPNEDETGHIGAWGRNESGEIRLTTADDGGIVGGKIPGRAWQIGVRPLRGHARCPRRRWCEARGHSPEPVCAVHAPDRVKRVDSSVCPLCPRTYGREAIHAAAARSPILWLCVRRVDGMFVVKPVFGGRMCPSTPATPRRAAPRTGRVAAQHHHRPPQPLYAPHPPAMNVHARAV